MLKIHTQTSANDYQVLGHNSPDWSLGLQNTLKYQNFDLSIYMYMRWGQMIKYDMLTEYDPTGRTTIQPTSMCGQRQIHLMISQQWMLQYL